MDVKGNINIPGVHEGCRMITIVIYSGFDGDFKSIIGRDAYLIIITIFNFSIKELGHDVVPQPFFELANSKRRQIVRLPPQSEGGAYEEYLNSHLVSQRPLGK